jgi:tetratricopeptide (TPR) repeat protein
VARTLFSHKCYFQAMHSYEHAGMLRKKAIAYAYHLREQARGIPVRNHPGDSQRRNAYIEVAAAFLASAQEATTVQERNEYNRIAAEAFLVLEDYAQAVKVFEKASNVTEDAQNYRPAGMLDETVLVIQNNSNVMDSSVASQLTDVARYYYLQRGGPLARLLGCLDHTWTIMVEAKTKLKKAARSDDRHESIEELMERQTKIKWVHDVHIA